MKRCFYAHDIIVFVRKFNVYASRSFSRETRGQPLSLPFSYLNDPRLFFWEGKMIIFQKKIIVTTMETRNKFIDTLFYKRIMDH